jgi:A/G-specific adenine glycosylase
LVYNNAVNVSAQQVKDFQDIVWQYYRRSGRHDLPWRQPEAGGTFDPYKILVSELMLQQTQANRVIPKYVQFQELFPTIEALARSSLAAVLTAWSGLGYNRRAKFLHQAAKTVVSELDGIFPQDIASLQQLPGVGKNTAGAILAYAFNQPVVFVETNIRTVYFHHFFTGRAPYQMVQGREVVSDGAVYRLVHDGEVIGVAGDTLDTANPREWYWALMDYGAYLKSSGMKLNTLSKHYTKQSRFAGSKRQIRGQVIKILAVADASPGSLRSSISDDRLDAVLNDLLREGLITKKANRYHLSD